MWRRLGHRTLWESQGAALCDSGTGLQASLHNICPSVFRRVLKPRQGRLSKLKLSHSHPDLVLVMVLFGRMGALIPPTSVVLAVFGHHRFPLGMSGVVPGGGSGSCRSRTISTSLSEDPRLCSVEGPHCASSPRLGLCLPSSCAAPSAGESALQDEACFVPCSFSISVSCRCSLYLGGSQSSPAASRGGSEENRKNLQPLFLGFWC